jgi:hypothetical protein
MTKTDFYKFGIYVSNSRNKDKKTNSQIMAKVTNQLDARIMCDALNRAVYNGAKDNPLSYTVKKF